MVAVGRCWFFERHEVIFFYLWLVEEGTAGSRFFLGGENFRVFQGFLHEEVVIGCDVVVSVVGNVVSYLCGIGSDSHSFHGCHNSFIGNNRIVSYNNSLSFILFID